MASRSAWIQASYQATPAAFESQRKELELQIEEAYKKALIDKMIKDQELQMAQEARAADQWSVERPGKVGQSGYNARAFSLGGTADQQDRMKLSGMDIANRSAGMDLQAQPAKIQNDIMKGMIGNMGEIKKWDNDAARLGLDARNVAVNEGQLGVNAVNATKPTVEQAKLNAWDAYQKETDPKAKEAKLQDLLLLSGHAPAKPDTDKINAAEMESFNKMYTRLNEVFENVTERVYKVNPNASAEDITAALRADPRVGPIKNWINQVQASRLSKGMSSDVRQALESMTLLLGDQTRPGTPGYMNPSTPTKKKYGPPYDQYEDWRTSDIYD